jgi:hypothetical protein
VGLPVFDRRRLPEVTVKLMAVTPVRFRIARPDGREHFRLESSSRRCHLERDLVVGKKRVAATEGSRRFWTALEVVSDRLDV